MEKSLSLLSYEYGLLGEVTKETRTLATHLNAGNGNQTAVMEYKSDYLGRMQYIVYPDGEKIVYGYDEGGQVVSVTGTHFNEEFKYVSDIGYDEYGQRIYIEYGNGVRTDYNYNKERRWLDTINTKNKWGVVLQNISYSFDRVGNVSGYTNVCTGEINGSYSTKQNYSYDGLYQLTIAEGETVYNPYKSVNPEFKSTYRQEFSFDQYGLGNMTAKRSSEVVTPNKKIGDDLNYNLDYVYDDNFAHRLVSIGNRYYKYDSNGNVTVEQDGSFDEETSTYTRTVETDDRGVKSTDYGWGLFKDTKSASESERYKRVYTWDEKNRLIASADSSYTVSYVYSESGDRTNKYTLSSETLYFNKMWTLHTDAGNATEGGQTSKHIYLGETRIVTKLNSGKNPTYSEEFNRQYYYHADHLGSAHLITDKDGNEYQRLEYTPYGEIWVDKTSNTGLQYLPYKFTGKEMDEETGLYYYGARYLDPKYSRWLSTDPALGEYIPQAPINDEARRNNANLPGMGGLFNHINCNLYHYGGNNPVKYVDPDGRIFELSHPRLNMYKVFTDPVIMATTNCAAWATGWSVNPLTGKNWDTFYRPGFLSGNLSYSNELDSSKYLDGLKNALIADLELTGATVTDWKDGDTIEKGSYIIGVGVTDSTFIDSTDLKEKNSFHLIRGDSTNKGKTIFWSEKPGAGAGIYVDSLGTKKPVNNGNKTNPPISIKEYILVKPKEEK